MRAFATLLLTVGPVLGAFSQPLPPPPPNPAIPLDGLVLVLIVASVAFGAYKLRGSKRGLLQKAS